MKEGYNQTQTQLVALRADIGYLEDRLEMAFKTFAKQNIDGL